MGIGCPSQLEPRSKMLQPDNVRPTADRRPEDLKNATIPIS
jgi:hypothetical protein